MFKEGIAKFLKLDNLMENLTGYVETRIELMKYDVKEDLSKILAKVSVLIVVAITAIFFLLFLSIALAVLLGNRIGYFAGFGIVSLVYVIAAAILYAKRETLEVRMEEKIKDVIKQKRK